MAKTISLGRHADVVCYVDDVDYEWALQWKWRITFDKHKRKMYATRNTRQRKVSPHQITVYMHKEILIRKGDVAPSLDHNIGEHADGDSLNNRRENLSYVTPKMNRATARKR